MGENNREILKEINYKDEEIDNFIKEKIIS
jgi:crotonobetainyl-CoA:carnitine CoA-transferase CaiB-like acyl-CoA transferase